MDEDIDIEELGALALLSQSNWSIDYLEGLDTSEFPFPNTLWHRRPDWEISLKTTLMLSIALIGIFLNLVILAIIARNRWLWSASNFLVANLALVDLLTLVLCPWPWLVRHFYQSYVIGEVGCKFEAFVQCTFLLAGVLAIMQVSYDRLASAALTAEARVTKAAAPRVVLGSWALAVGLSVPWIFNREYTERQWLDYLEAFCRENSFLKVYWHIVVTILVWVPLGLMIVTYGGILWRLERSARKLKTRGGGQLVGRAKGKAMKIAACVLVVGASCRLPYTVMVYWRNSLEPVVNSVDEGYGKMWFAANCLMYIDCVVNPLIYGFTNERFRRAMDRTPGLVCFRFGSWCCVCNTVKKPPVSQQEKNTEKIFVIEGTPKQDKRISYLIKNMLHIYKDSLEFSVPKTDDTNKPTRITPLKTDGI
ncbi:hypothetical protein JYU34_001517 [Plutella xylostella]|uniref:G-protein coupled receptors family 1 profile domain-containing protein n=1 Tax=Plutella xylostella TaxID=51655 RepID=A0ABQ7R444_PLUXY|nr:hypothetical protein JYU34_001517 [Plutella xylostella]